MVLSLGGLSALQYYSTLFLLFFDLHIFLSHLKQKFSYPALKEPGEEIKSIWGLDPAYEPKIPHTYLPVVWGTFHISCSCTVTRHLVLYASDREISDAGLR